MSTCNYVFEDCCIIFIVTRLTVFFEKYPTSAIKRKIISILNELEKQGFIDSELKHQLSSTSEYLE